MTTRQRPEEPHERNTRRWTCGNCGPRAFVRQDAEGRPYCGRCARYALRPFLPAWIAPANRAVGDHLRAFAAKYPDRFVYVDGKLKQRGRA